MTDAAALAGLVNLRSRGLEEALALHRAGDDEAAGRACAAVFRARLAALPEEPWGTEPDCVARADALLENRLSLLDLPEQTLSNPIDWVYYPQGDCQWQSHLGYLSWARALLDAHARTGELRYIDKWKSVHWDFLTNHPYGTDTLQYSTRLPCWENEYLPVYGGEGFCPGYIGGSWISLAAASRTETWILSLAYLARRGLAGDDILIPMVASLVTEHREVLLDAPRRGTPNQYVSCAGALLRLGTLFWECRGAAAAYLVGMERLEAAVRLCELPDGTDAEQSFGYNFGLARHLGSILRVCGLQGNRRMERLRERGERRCDALALLLAPGGHYPDLAKTHWAGNGLESLRAFCRLFPGAEQARQVLDAMEHGACGPALWTDFPYGGYTVHRTGWGAQDAYLFFKYSRHAPGHKHEDTNGITLCAFGRQLLADSGNFNYSDDEASQRMHRYFFASAAHNTADLDGLSQRRLALDGGFKVDERHPERTDNETEYEKVASVLRLGEIPCPGGRYHSPYFDAAEGRYEDGWQEKTGDATYTGPVTAGCHRRQVIFVRPYAWVLVDRLLPADGGSHGVTLHWHPGPDIPQEALRPVPQGFDTLTSWGNLTLRSYGSAAPETARWYGSQEPFRGWYAADYAVRVPAWDVALTFRGAGLQTLVTLLYPHPGMDAPEITGGPGFLQAQLPEGLLTAEVSGETTRVSFGGRTLLWDETIREV